MNRSLLTARECAKRLDVEVQQIWRYIKAKRIAAEKLGFQYVVRTDDLEKFIPTRRKPGHPKRGEVIK